jgi:hypothetical protein
MLRLNRSVTALVAVGMLAAGSASAATLSFIESTTASGSLSGASFSNALVTFSGTGDTNDITVLSPGIYGIVGVPVSVTIAGLGSANFTDMIQLVSNTPNNDIGIGDTDLNQGILFTGVTNSGYDLSTSYGPVSGTAILNPGQAYATSAGSFVLNTAGATTYQATVGAVSAAPEPVSWALMLLGFSAVGSTLRGRRTKALSRS